MQLVCPQEIRLIFYLPNLKNYRDRAHLVGIIASRVGRALLVVSKMDEEPEVIGFEGDLEIVQVPAGKGLRFPGKTLFAASRFIENLLQKEDFNLVHDTFGHLSLLMLRRHRYPYCTFVTSHFNLAEWDFRHYFLPRYGWFKLLKNPDLRMGFWRIFMQRMAFSLADHIVLQGPGLIERLRQYIPVPRQKIHWIPNNITDCQSPDALDQTQQANSGEAIKLLVAGGAFTVGKGGDVLLDLLHRARLRGIAIQATVLGGFHVGEAFLKSRIRQLGVERSLHIIPERVSRERVDEFYKESDWLFHYTRLDGSPRTVLEALSLGLPVMGSHHPGIEVLDPEGKFVLFFDVDNLDAVLDELTASKRDGQRYQKRVVCGLNRVKEHLTSDAVSIRYIELYTQLIGEKKERRS
jgi:glycosyltransferase involved in cell wall biosynthesis